MPIYKCDNCGQERRTTATTRAVRFPGVRYRFCRNQTACEERRDRLVKDDSPLRPALR